MSESCRTNLADAVSDIDGPVILHLDLDAFFVQVERQRDSSLINVPVAVQQHQDTIAISYEARVLGLTKHTPPVDVRKNFPQVRLVHVHTVGGKASYKFYRAASRSVFSVIQSFGYIMEKRGMDEAYIDVTDAVRLRVQHSSNFGGAELASPPAGRHDQQVLPSPLAIAYGLALELQAEVQKATGYVSSLGISTCKAASKAASKAAKPAGVFCLTTADWQKKLEEYGIGDVPGCGGALSDEVVRHFGTDRCKQLLHISQLELKMKLGDRKGEKVYCACRGIDESPVTATTAPKSIQSQCSLTPLVLLQREDGRGDDAYDVSLLDPTPPWAVHRLRNIVDILAADIAERIHEDMAEFRRYATTLTLTIQLYTCGPKEVGCFGRQIPMDFIPKTEARKTEYIAQEFEGAVVIWPQHEWPVASGRVNEGDVRQMPVVKWRFSDRPITRGSGQNTSKSVMFPVEAYSAALSADEKTNALSTAVLTMIVPLMVRAADADGWSWDGTVVTSDVRRVVEGPLPDATEATVPGVGDKELVGTTGWMTHRLGLQSEGQSPWLHRYTIPLSVVKLSVSASNFSSGMPSGTLRHFTTQVSGTKRPRQLAAVGPLDDSTHREPPASVPRVFTPIDRVANKIAHQDANSPPSPILVSSQASGVAIGAGQTAAQTLCPSLPATLSDMLREDARCGGKFITSEFANALLEQSRGKAQSGVVDAFAQVVPHT